MRDYNKSMSQERKAALLIFCFLLSALLIQPVIGQKAPGSEASGRLLELRISSPSLKGNLLGDSMEQSVAVYLPPSYDSSRTKRYPTLYLLHGFNGKIEHFTRNGYQGMNLQPLMDGMIKSDSIGEMIVVVPNGTNNYLASYYTNSSVTGNWQDYVVRDVVSYIDSHYRTLARAESRGVAGHSMGGYGAIMMGMQHPDVFGAVYAMSPCCLGFEGDLGADNPAWSKALKVTSADIFKKE
ncbi:MAG: prolyl oligopeptidase family serine peptidase, partial [Acidobacteria bacterium]|nr:prolyl oligopeptidase family serine peptidase [Acidobacteriota bacterium]